MRIALKYIKQAGKDLSEYRPDMKYCYKKLKQHFKAYQKGNYDHFLKCRDFSGVPIKKNSLV